MRVIESVIGITVGTVLLAAGPAPAATGGDSPTIGWTTADAVAAQRVAGDILGTRLQSDGGRPAYHVVIQTADNRLEDVRVDAHTGTLIDVHGIADPGVLGELEAP